MGVALAVALGPGSLACASPSSSAGAPSLPTMLLTSDISSVDGDASPQPTAPLGVSTTPTVGIAAGLVAELDRATVGGDEPENANTDSGTDSALAEPPAPLAPAIESQLIDFGRRYLEFDYRTPTSSPLAAVQAVVTPALYAALVAPLPAALVESLVAEQLVVTAEFVAIDGVEGRIGGGGVYQLTYLLTVTRIEPGAGRSEQLERTQILVVVVDGNDLVEDVR